MEHFEERCNRDSYIFAQQAGVPESTSRRKGAHPWNTVAITSLPGRGGDRIPNGRAVSNHIQAGAVIWHAGFPTSAPAKSAISGMIRMIPDAYRKRPNLNPRENSSMKKEDKMGYHIKSNGDVIEVK